MNVSTVILLLAFVFGCIAQRRTVISSDADRSANNFNKQQSSSRSTTTTTTTTTTISSISNDSNSSDNNATESKGLLDFFRPSKETSLNNTGSATASVASGNTIKDTITTFLFQTDTCFGKVAGWEDPVLGNFTTTKDSPYCDSRCARNFFCCAPFKPDQADVKFIYSNDRQDGRPVSPKDTSLRDELRQSNRPLAFVIHGFLNNYQFDSYFNETRDGLVQKGYDVIVVDWARANRLYLQSIANVRIVGALVGHFIKSLEYADRSTCIGFSLGSHICGEAGKWLRQRQMTLAKCHGIDPAGPAFDGCGPELRLDPSDCGVVTAVHTSGYKSPSSILKEGLGTTEKTGHCDFWVNNGFYQPNCDNGTLLGMKLELFKGKFGRFAQQVEHSLLCSHGRAMYYLVSHVKGVCHFKGREARNCGEGRECQVVRSRRSAEYDEDESYSSSTRRPHGYSSYENRPSYGSESTSRRPQQWQQGQRPSYSTESTNDYTSSSNSNSNKFNRATSRPNSWNQGQDTYTTRKPDSLLASGSNGVNTWRSTTARPGYGYNVYSSTTSYDSSHSNDDVSHDTLGGSGGSNNNHNSDNDRGTTSRPYRGTHSSSTKVYDDNEYSTRRPGNSYQETGSRPYNGRSTSRPSYLQTSSSSSSYSTERPGSSWNQGSSMNRPSNNQNSDRDTPYGSNGNRPQGNGNYESNSNRPGSSSNQNNGDRDRPYGSSNNRPGNNWDQDSNSNRPSGNNNQNGQSGDRDRPYGSNNNRPGNNWDQESNSNRPGNNNQNSQSGFRPSSSNNNWNQESNSNRPSSSGNRPDNSWNQGSGSNSNSNSNSNRPNQGSRPFGGSPNGGNQNHGSNSGHNSENGGSSTSFNSRPPNNNNNNNHNSGNNNQQGGGGIFGQPNRPGNNFGGNGQSMMSFPPDDHCTSDMNVDYYVVTSGYEPYC